MREEDLTDSPSPWKELFKFETLISELSAQFINLPLARIDEEIEKGQRRVCESLGFHSSVLSELSSDKTSLISKYCWYDQGRDYAKPYRIVDSDLLAFLFKRFEEDNMFTFHDFMDLDKESEPVKRICKKTGIKGGYVFPLRVGENIMGAISWESHGKAIEWQAALVDRLRLVSEVFANVLSRRRTETALRESIMEIKKLKDRLQTENLYLLNEISVEYSHHEIVGKSHSIKKLLTQIEQVADTGSTVLILGETGTGKELVARAIHNLSPRKRHPMVKVNCSALPSTLIESELFGHEKGAYSGALSKKPGRFEVAQGSTIFLDEIGELALELQPKLLRVLQEGQFERVGGVHIMNVDVRVIAATNRDLVKAIREGGFRKDLYYRLNIFPIIIAPLRERLEDIPLLVSAFVEEFSRRMGKKIENIPNESIRALQQYDWPGNIRELRNIVERAMIISKGKTLRIQLPETGECEMSLLENIDDVQRKHILKVLEKCDWRVSGSRGAARILGINPSTLRFRMDKLNIQRERGFH